MHAALKQRVTRALGLALAACLASGASVGAQELGTFAGTVLDDVSGRPLRRAVVSIRGLELQGTTNENGQFLIEGVPAGRHDVKFEAPGYVSVLEQLEIASADFLQIRLDPVAAVLDQILVLAGRTPPAGAVGVVAEPEGDRPWESALDLLEDQVPGVTVRRGGGVATGAAILIRGFNSFRSDGAPVILVDGVRIDNAQAGINTVHALEIIPADVVSRIRVFKGASGASGYANGANGVILIETIRGIGSRD
jgi:outer membrane receptor protein involved in Fe transport